MHGQRSITPPEYVTLTANPMTALSLTTDLLAKGRSTGQTARYLFNPEKRRRDEQAELEALNPPEDKPASQGDKQSSQGDPPATEEPESPQPPEAEEAKEPARFCFNMVCYGLPNLMVTQIGKV